jgi:cobalt/nickel transport system ATP-binding protein
MTKYNNIIRMKHCSFSYPGRRPILRDMSLEINTGDRIGLIGANGAGKTTLFHLLSGIHQADSGEILLYENPLIKGEFRPELGMVFQDQDDQVFCPSVKDDIAFGPNNMGFSPHEVDQRVNTAAERLGIHHLLERAPHHLSGGEKRLVALAGIIAMKSSFVIYDEPTSNLDMRYRRSLICFLNEHA